MPIKESYQAEFKLSDAAGWISCQPARLEECRAVEAEFHKLNIKARIRMVTETSEVIGLGG